ncbi:hypothetical protein [Campylobacter upsaliensis]|uniref:hypothetical protein n=1 Tax=Campylobacter upsaliensis TaxID=28080 RepID=UPI0022EBA3CC|nr:hypothetical protein [Campylobacter upsaliensis]MEB2816843.1 hypothetical protein [Campylobacter upsaliensis]
MKYVLALVITLFISACAHHTSLESLEPRKSTKNDVRAILGEPNCTTTYILESKEPWYEMWAYDLSKRNNFNGNNFGSTGSGNIIFHFDPQGRFIQYFKDKGRSNCGNDD